ncbi:SMC-Scp complex subunit ScpB [Kaarinaea lacus]
MSIEIEKLTNIVEAALLAFGQPLSVDRLMSLFTEEEQVSRQDIREALQRLQQACDGNGVELVEVGSGFRYQARKDYAQWVAKLWEEKPPRYSRALLETLVLVAYRQPITRAEIEDIRGVSVSSHIMKTLQERDWVRVVGHKDVPGKPALYATTKSFLDYFNLKSLDELPSLMEIRDLDKISAEIDRQNQEISSDQQQASADAQALTDEEDIERLLPDGDADHGDGIEDTVAESIAAQAIDESSADAMVAEALALALSESDQSPETVTDSETLQDIAVAKDENTIELIEVESGEQSDIAETTEVTTIDEQTTAIEGLEQEYQEVQEQNAEAGTLELSEDNEFVADDQEELAEHADTLLSDTGDSAAQNADDVERLEPMAAAYNEFAEVNAVAMEVVDSEFDQTEHAETARLQGLQAEDESEQSSEQSEEAHFSTANYGLRVTEDDQAGHDDSEYGEDEHEHQSDRLSAAEPNT